MPPREGPRLEKRKHLEAEQRLRTSILAGKDYEGKDADIALVKRKRREGREVRIGRDGIAS